MTLAAERISVVIPCYNAERYIAAAIRSVLSQEWPDLEVIVVDDGSKDASCELVRREFPQVVLVQQPNQGVAAARNLGIEKASGQWIALLDADDYWLPGKLHAQWKALQSVPGARMAYSAWQVWDSTDAAPSEDYVAQVMRQAGETQRWKGPSGWIYPALLIDCYVWSSTVLVHRAVLDEVGLFDRNLRIGEDYDLWLRASRVTPIVRVAAPGALYRQHLSSITRGVPSENYRGVVVGRALQRWGYQSPDGGVADRRQVNRALAKSWVDFADAQMRVGNLPRARHALWTTLRVDWRLLAAWKSLAKMVVKSVQRVAT